ncbi:MAG: glycosyltransferase, partial [Desulfobacterales bacterium]
MFFISEDWYFWSHRLPLALALRDLGWDVYLATRVSTFRKRIERENIHLMPLTKFRRKMQSPGKEVSSFFEILTLYRKIKPDIIHQVAMKPVIVGTMAARIARIDRVINAFGGLGFLFTTKSKLKAIFKKLAFFTLKVVFDTPRVRLILQNTEDLKLMLSEGIISKDQAVIIKGSGVNLTLFHPGCEPCSPPLVVLPSRMLWDKGVGEFVQAANLINSNGRKAIFALVGGPDADNPTSISIRQLEDWHSAGYHNLSGFHTRSDF